MRRPLRCRATAHDRLRSSRSMQSSWHQAPGTRGGCWQALRLLPQRGDHAAAVALMARQGWWARLAEYGAERVPAGDAAALGRAAEALTAAGRAADAEAVLRRLDDKTVRPHMHTPAPHPPPPTPPPARDPGVQHSIRCSSHPARLHPFPSPGYVDGTNLPGRKPQLTYAEKLPAQSECAPSS